MGKPSVFLDSESESDSDFESNATTSETHTDAAAVEVVDVDDESEEEGEDTEEVEETKEEVYAGLAAEELRDERLFAGDTIEYYSMAFVFGDPRGYRVAKVLKIAQREREYPLRLDSQEMLPNTLMIKRQLTRQGEELEPGSAVWRKIRTFILRDGEVQGKTRADRLNEGLANAVTDSFKTLRSEFSAKSKNDKPTSSISSQDAKKKDKAARGTLSITSFMTAKAPAKKGALEAVAAPRLSLPNKSERSEERADSSSFMSKPLSKRSRVELTPSPSEQQRRRHNRDRDHSRSSLSSASHKHKHKGDDRRHHSSSSNPRERVLDLASFRRPKDKMELTKFMEHIVEEKSNPRLDLDSYLALDRQEREVINDFETTRTVKQQGRMRDKDQARASSASASNSSRMRAGGGSAGTGRSDAKKGGANTVRMRSMENFFRPPPRPHGNGKSRIETSPGDAKLNFFIDTENQEKHGGAFSRPPSKSEKSHSRDIKEQRARDRDAPTSPKKKGLANTWLDAKRRTNGP